MKFSDTADERLYFRRYDQLDKAADDDKVIRIIDHNKDYFTVLNKDADLVASAVYRTMLVLKNSPGMKHRYVTISPQVFTASVLPLCLVEKGMRVLVHDAKLFALIASASPGNVELILNTYGVELEFGDGLSPVVAAIKCSGQSIGLCAVDVLLSLMWLSDFDDSENFSTLESVLIQLGVREVVIAQRDLDSSPPLTQCFSKNAVLISPVKSLLFSSELAEDDLIKVLHNASSTTLGSLGIDAKSCGLSLACAEAIICHLNLLSAEAMESAYSIFKFVPLDLAKLDASSVRALNVFPQQLLQSGISSASNSSISSLYQLLNKCSTAMGARELSTWLKQPLTSWQRINDRHLLVQLMMDDSQLRVSVRDTMDKMPDIKRIQKKMSVAATKLAVDNKILESIVSLYQIVDTALPSLITTLQEQVPPELKPLVATCWLDPLSQSYNSLIKFHEMVETTIDLSPLHSSLVSGRAFADFNIKPEFDESLVEINEQLQSSLTDIQQIHQDVADDLNIEKDKKLKLERHAQHGWCFRVTRIDSAVLRNTGNKYTQLQTVKAGVFFNTKALAAMLQQYADSLAEYSAKQRELVKEILSIALTYKTVFQAFSSTIAHLDVVASFATVALVAPTPFVRPKMHAMAPASLGPEYEARRVRLEKARHPLLEVQEDIRFIANDIFLGNSGKDSEKPYAIITGPNMGGKSTFIRQMGCISLLAQIGSFIPASDDNSEPELPIFDAILSRVGAGDSQLKGLSTFMIEMLETSSILNTATHNSLIIIDELGRGTSTYDGFGLAWLILEHLITAKSCTTLFATHFHELTQLSEKYPRKVDNLHVIAHIERDNGGQKDDDITLMYRVEPGISDKSFGIHVAELARFPTKIINMAKRKSAELQDAKLCDKNDVILAKRTKCSSQEIQQGTDVLKRILKQWRSECYDPSTNKCMFSSDEVIARLRKMLTSDFASELATDKYIQEISSVL